MGGVFLSYRRDDSAGYAHSIYARLVQNFSKDLLFMDVDTIEPGDRFARVIEDRLAKCEVLIALIGKRWIGQSETSRRIDDPKDFVRLEISKALEKPNITVIPVLVDGMSQLSRDTLPEDLKALTDLHWLEISNTRFSYDLDRLMTRVRDRVRVPVSPIPEMVYHDPPWYRKFSSVAYWAIMALFLTISLLPILDEQQFHMANTALRYFFVRVPLVVAFLLILNTLIFIKLPFLRALPSMPIKKSLRYVIIIHSFWFAISFLSTGYKVETFWMFWFMPIATIALAFLVVLQTRDITASSVRGACAWVIVQQGENLLKSHLIFSRVTVYKTRGNPGRHDRDSSHHADRICKSLAFSVFNVNERHIHQL